MIDNTKYYNASLAYDFSMFEEKQKKEVKTDENVIKINKITQERKKTEQKTARISFIKGAATVLFLLVFVFTNIQLNLMVNETNDKIKKIKAEIIELEGEKTALQMEYLKKVSYSNIELQATQMGMCKAKKDQIKYMRVNDKDTFRKGD